MYMGTNRKFIKRHGKNEGLSYVVFEQTQGHLLWDSLLEGEVMSYTPPSFIICIIVCINIVACIIAYIIINFELIPYSLLINY